MTDKILLSKQKIEDLRKELAALEQQVQDHHESEHENIRASYKESTVSDVAIASKVARVKKIRNILKNAEKLHEKIHSEIVALGSYLTLENEDGKILNYRLVHPLEADPAKGLLSFESPFAKCILGKKTGDKIMFNKSLFTIINFK